MSKKDLLSKNIRICLEIYKSGLKREPICFSDLEKRLKGHVSKVTLSHLLGKLLDLGVVVGDWDKKDGLWLRTYKISMESELAIKAIYLCYNRKS